jgi:type IV secretory pathway VirB10-like protein
MVPGIVVAVVVLASFAAYWWWQSRPLDPTTLTRWAPLPRLMQLRRATVFGLLVLALTLSLGTVYLVRRTIVARQAPQRQSIPLATTTPVQAPAAADFLRKLPKDYAAPPELAPEPAPQPKPPLPPKGVPVPQAPVVAAAPPPATPPPPALTRGDIETLLRGIMAQQQAESEARTAVAIAKALNDYDRAHPQPAQPAPTPQAVPATKPGPEDWKWKFTEEGTTLGTRFKKGEQEKAEKSQLFPKATWEIPANPDLVIYSSQLIHGQLAQAVVTGETATVRIKVTQTLYDRFGHQTPLIPMDSTILGTIGGKIKRGQTRIPMEVHKVELPDGADLALEGKAGDATGAAGIPGDVDNRYPQIALAAVLTTLFALAPTVAAGNSQNFQPTIEQDLARNFGQSVNQTGQQFVKDALAIEPIISAKVGDPMTVQLSKNISLQTRPVVVHK